MNPLNFNDIPHVIQKKKNDLIEKKEIFRQNTEHSSQLKGFIEQTNIHHCTNTIDDIF